MVERAETRIDQIRLETADGQAVPIESDFSELSGEHLPAQPVSDGRGGFVFAVTDYDDSGPTRDSYLMHVPAGSDRAVVVTEPQGVGELAVVQSEQGWKTIYTTMLDTEVKTWDLATHDEPVSQQVGGDPIGPAGVGSGDDLYIVYWLSGCPSVRLFAIDGAELEVPGAIEELGCDGVSREYIKVTPDGARLVLLELTPDEEMVVIDVETGEERARWPVDGYGHLLDVTNGEGLVRGEAGLAIVDLGTGGIRPHQDVLEIPRSIRYEEIVLNPDLILDPVGTDPEGET